MPARRLQPQKDIPILHRSYNYRWPYLPTLVTSPTTSLWPCLLIAYNALAELIVQLLHGKRFIDFAMANQLVAKNIRGSSKFLLCGYLKRMYQVFITKDVSYMNAR